MSFYLTACTRKCWGSALKRFHMSTSVLINKHFEFGNLEIVA